MPDRIEPPRFDRLVRRLRVAAWLAAGFIVLPLAAWLAHRYW